MLKQKIISPKTRGTLTEPHRMFCSTLVFTIICEDGTIKFVEKVGKEYKKQTNETELKI